MSQPLRARKESPPPAETPRQAFRRVRSHSLALVAPLSAEDAALQSMPDASPAKWHLGHTTWFFEQFVLGRDARYTPHDARWHFLFNSYYQSVGPMHARPQRGLLSRPALAEVLDYRAVVDDRVDALLEQADADTLALVELGLHHEQQHQELLLTDLKHLFSCNPLRPAYCDAPPSPGGSAPELRFVEGRSGIVEVGHAGEGFAFDCETPRHAALLQPHALANRCVTNAEYRAFIDDGGYREPMLWLSQGWNTVQEQGWSRPLYWDDDLDSEFTLHGVQAIEPQAPACHLSYFEADAFARWAGARLPTEFEWEGAATAQAVAASASLHPQATHANGAHHQLHGAVWQWTASAYASYPGFRPLGGSLGEYNGKFMCGQQVLRGSSCVTPPGHARASYRNFFYPADRWQFMGIRLAKDLP